MNIPSSPVTLIAEFAILATAFLALFQICRLLLPRPNRLPRAPICIVVAGIAFIVSALIIDLAASTSTYFNATPAGPSDISPTVALPWVWSIFLSGLAVTFAGIMTFSRALIFRQDGLSAPLVGSDTDNANDLGQNRSFEKNRKLLASVLEKVPARVTIKNLDGRFIYANTAAEKYINRGQQTLIGSPSTDFMQPEMRTEMRAMDRRVIDTRETIAEETAPRLAGRRGDALMMTKFPMISETDDVVGVVTISTDISHIRDAEAKIISSEARTRDAMEEMRKITDALPMHISYVDAEGRYVYVNAAYENWYGRPRVEIEGKRAKDLIGPKNKAAISGFLEKAMSGKEFAWSGWIESPQGLTCFVERSCVPNFDDSGTQIGFFSAMSDLTERRKTEESLEESERLLKAVMENVPVGIAIKDTQGRYILVNPVAEKTLGGEKGGLIGQKTAWNLPPETAADMQKLDAVVLKTQKPITHEVKVVLPDREETSLVSKFPIMSSSNEVVGLGTIATNITGIKEIEQALKENEARLRNIVEQQMQTVGRFDSAGMLTFVNDAMCKLHGKPREELIGKHFLQGNVSEERQREIKTHFASITKNNPTAEIDDPVVDAEGNLRWYHFVNKAIFDENDNITEYQFFGLDITDQRAAEEARQIAEDRLRAIMDAVPVLISYIGTDLRYITVNKAYERWFGRKIDEICGLHVRDVIGEHAAYLIAPELDAARSGRQVTYEKNLPYKDIGERHVQGTYIPDRSPEGELRGFISVSTDITNAKRAEEELRRSEARYRTVVDSQSDLIGRSLADGTRTFANDALCRFVGEPREKLLGQSVFSRLPEEDAEKYRSILASNKTMPQLAERRAVTANNEMRWVHWIDTPILDETGKVVEIQSVGRDITDRKLAEIELKESESRYRRLVETMNDGLVIEDENGVVVFVNDRMLEIFGISRDEATGKKSVELVPAYGDKFREVEPLRRRGEGSRYLLELPHPDGTISTLSIAGYPIMDENGEYRGNFAIADDITEQKAVEVALRDNERRLRVMTNAFPQFISYLDTEGRYQWVNTALEDWFRRGSAEIVGKLPDELDGSIYYRELSDLTKQAIVESIPATIEFELPRPGDEKDLRSGYCNLVPDFDDGGILQGYFAITFDITEQRKNEAELRQAKSIAEQANLSKSRFLAAASHDLRQPLQGMRLLLHTLENTEDPKRRDHAVNGLGAALGVTSTLLDALLDISKLDAGVIVPDIMATHTGDIIGDMATRFEPEAEAYGIDLCVVSSDLMLFTDPILIKRIIGNFMSNALKFADGKKVLLGCRRRGDHLAIQVWDQGAGIPPDEQEKIFEEFYQFGRQRIDSNKGLGLGLAIAARLSHLLNHEITLHSTPGAGSMFAVVVPLAPQTTDAG